MLKNKHFPWLVVAIMFLGLSALLISGAIELFAGTPLYCKDLFPGNCTQGGCDGEGGWWAINCEIHCRTGLEIKCGYPPAH